MRRLLITGWLAVAAPLVCAAAEPPLSVTAVRFWSLADVTRVAVETNGEFRFRYERLSDPARYFFDLRGARPALGGKSISIIAVNDRLLKRIRVAENQPGTTRVVLDLESEVDITSSQLSGPDRLMIELRPKGKTAPEVLSSAPSVTGVEKLADTPRLARAFVPPPPAPVRRALRPGTLDPPAFPLRASAAMTTSAMADPFAMRAAPVAARSISTPAAPAIVSERTLDKSASGLPAARPARRTSAGSSTMVRALGLKAGRVVLDAGHGGHDQGSAGPTGLLEKDLALDVTRRLGDLIEERLGMEVVYTRSDDTFISLEGRTEIANQKEADLFLSVHANSSAYAAASGIETYYLNYTTTREALDVAARENATSRRSIHDLRDLIQKIAMNDKLAESREFASKMQTALYGMAARANPNARNRGVKRAPFVVLIGAQMPSVLCEIGFLSNPREEALLKKPEHRQKIAEALYRGVQRYAETLAAFQVARAKD